jgi:hypothetical protein
VPKFLHVLNGDCTRIILEQTHLPGETVVWADVLHDGPAPAGLSPDQWRELRFSPGDAMAGLRRADEQLARHAEYDEVVFWFEHDLFDQLLLIRHLDWIKEQVEDRGRFRLICIGSYPGRPRFSGLGELRPDELAALFPSRQPITDTQVALGSVLWRAFGAADPLPLARLVLETDTSPLPYVAGALRRHLEDRVFMGDLTFFGILKRLNTGRTPLLEHNGEWRGDVPPSGVFSLTAAGRRVLAGDADYIALNGIDRWMGGVHVRDGQYRWSKARLTLVSR